MKAGYAEGALSAKRLDSRSGILDGEDSKAEMITYPNDFTGRDELVVDHHAAVFFDAVIEFEDHPRREAAGPGHEDSAAREFRDYGNFEAQ